MNSVEASDLPENWSLAPLEDVVERKRGRKNPQNNPDLPYIGLKHIEQETMELSGKAKGEDYSSSSVYFKPNDILYGRLRPYLNKVHLVNFEGLGSGELIVLTPTDSIKAKYLAYVINSQEFVRYANQLSTGDRPRVNYNKIKQFNIPLPPVSEQKLIVERIDKLVSKLDSGIREIDSASQTLDFYEKSLLDYSMSGNLTAQWRQANAIDSVSVEDLIEKVSYSCNDDLINVPDNWEQVSLGSISEVIPGNSPPSDTYNKEGEGIPLINGPNEFGSNPFSETQQTKFTTEPKKKCKKGDLIICVRGSTTGRINIASCDAAIGRGVAAIRSNINQDFLNYYIRSKQEYILNEGTGTTYPSVSSKFIRQMPFPLPPIIEQEMIVQKLDRKFSIISDMEPTLKSVDQRAKNLRKSILKSAFRGDLLRQDRRQDESETVHFDETKKDNQISERQSKLTEVIKNE